MRPVFESSRAGGASRLPDDARLECKICWYVYDPEVGCDTWQIPPGTSFARLPDAWSCPNCDARKEDFMIVTGD